MGRFEKVCVLAKEKGVPVREILVKHLEPLQVRVKVVEKFNKAEDEEMEPDDLYQLCDTPPSQKKLLRFF